MIDYLIKPALISIGGTEGRIKDVPYSGGGPGCARPTQKHKLGEGGLVKFAYEVQRVDFALAPAPAPPSR